MPDDTPPLQSWHLDKRVPIALIGSLAFQTALGVWWASEITAEGRQTRERVAKLETHETEDRKEAKEVSGAIYEVKAQIAELLRGIQRVENTLTRRDNQGRQP